MSFFTLLRNTSTSGKMDFGGNHWEADGMAGNRLSAVRELYSAFLPWKKTTRRILLSNFSKSSVTFCQLTSLGTGQNTGPFLRREHSASVSSDEVRLIGLKSGKLTSVFTSWSLTSLLVGILIFLWVVILKLRALLLVLLGCMV